MLHRSNLPKPSDISEDAFHANLVAGLSRVAVVIGRGNLADKSGRTTRALDNIFSGSNSGETYKKLLDLLCADMSALDEVLALYGVGIHPLPSDDSDPGREIDEIEALHALTGAKLELMRGGKRDHRNVIQMGDKARPVAMAAHRAIAAADNAKRGQTI